MRRAPSSFLADRARWLLLAILAVALLLRLAGIRFGLPALNDPDELMFELGALRMLRGPTLDPGWFGHPATTTMYVLALTNVAAAAGAVAAGYAASSRAFVELVYADPSWMILPGRLVMTLFALASIVLTFRLGRRLFGPAAGLAAAALLAVSPVHVTYSQIIRSDMMACVFMLLCLQAAADIAETGSRRAYLTATLWLGVAIATKWPFALSVLGPAAASMVAARRGVLGPRDASVRLLATCVGAVTVLLIVSPYLLIDHATVLRNIRGEGQAHHLGATGGGPWQNLLWYAAGPIWTGFGVVGLALVTAGAVRMRGHAVAIAVLVPVAAGFVLLLSVQHLVWERWALPLMPLGAIVAGAGLAQVAAWARTIRPALAPWIVGAMLVATLVPLGLRAANDNAVRLHDTRQIASAWARRNIPRGSTVLVEHFAFDILGEPWRFLFPLGDKGCVDVRDYLHGKVAYNTIEQGRGGRSNVDYGTVSPAARETCRADFVISTQADRYARERDRFPAEDAAYRALAASGRPAATIAPEPGRTGGPVVTILDLRPAL